MPGPEKNECSPLYLQEVSGFQGKGRNSARSGKQEDGLTVSYPVEEQPERTSTETEFTLTAFQTWA